MVIAKANQQNSDDLKPIIKVELDDSLTENLIVMEEKTTTFQSSIENYVQSAKNDDNQKQESRRIRKDVPEEGKMEQLKFQNEYNNSIAIVGLPGQSCLKSKLMELVFCLCNYINVPIRNEDIRSINRSSDYKQIFVEFYNSELKEEILRSKKLRNLTTNLFLQTHKCIKVTVIPRLTKYFERICLNAIEHCKKKRIYSYRIGPEGLAIRRSQLDTFETFVRSCKELDDVVYSRV